MRRSTLCIRMVDSILMFPQNYLDLISLLQEVVKHLLSSDQKEVKYMFNPFTCVQCSTDFTPVWKRDKPGSKNVICERCITSNQKQILKQEHTAKLKAAFVKSLQQEQDIGTFPPILDRSGILRHSNSYLGIDTYLTFFLF